MTEILVLIIEKIMTIRVFLTMLKEEFAIPKLMNLNVWKKKLIKTQTQKKKAQH